MNWQVFRALIPSWRFFGDATAMPELWIERAGGWVRCPLSPLQPRSLGNLLLNSEENYCLAARSALAQLLDDLDHDRSTRVSCALVTALAAREAGGHSVRFKVTLEGEDRLVSPVSSCPS